MFLGRVIGTVVASAKVPGLEGVRMLFVQPITETGADRGGPVVAADTTQAGEGDIVHLTSSREAAVAMPEPFVPVDHAIIAIVDSVGGELPTVATTWPAGTGASS
ncbi:MAG: EutN/CcmL family microcompartment protein [Myxococcales bacterium]|nr:EutN/CcmL family microcompartment protein [Myxococcales bacterium]